jgi:nondiscriminating aspartyl-tRNA synthetase
MDSELINCRISELSPTRCGQRVRVRARVAIIRIVSNKLGFILLRQHLDTIQAVIAVAQAQSELMSQAKSLARESIIEIIGTISQPHRPVDHATQHETEIMVHGITVISSPENLPVQVEACAQPDATTSDLARVTQETRLNHRVIDLRTPANQGIFRLQAAVGRLFREFLVNRGFLEIHTPKLNSAASEGGSSVFPVKYFDREAYLAQSPQLYKQMMMGADFERVFEIGPVFRAENSNTYRHLTEFTSMDLEMTLNRDYTELLTLVEELMECIFTRLPQIYARELEAIRTQFSFSPIVWTLPTGKPLRLTFAQGVEILGRAGVTRDPQADLSTNEEHQLGELIKAQYGVDFYILDQFPLAVRPFYTMPSTGDYANAFDAFLRGEEILSGSQRLHSPDALSEAVRHRGLNAEPIRSYLDAFNYGMPPHGGCGIGLERFVMLYLGLNNIRRTSLFPRDPTRLTP